MILSRRELVKMCALAPVALALPSLAFAKDAGKSPAPANALPESDPMANALKYKSDASKADAMRTDKKAFCSNCSKFNKCSPAEASCKPVAKGSSYAPCELFAGKQVASTGWCLSWSK